MGIKIDKAFTWTATGLLLAYFAFTSGAVYALADHGITQLFVTPYSLALSGEETGLVGIYTEDDRACAEWVAEHNAFPVTGDYNARILLFGYVKVANVIRPEDSVASRYFLIRKWNFQHGKMITGDYGAGLRGTEPLPDIDGWQEVYRSGRSAVYKW